MKIRLEIITDTDSQHEEIVIRCKNDNDTAKTLCRQIEEMLYTEPAIIFFKENKEFYVDLNDVIFFETEKDVVYAHTIKETYKVKLRLYELEGILSKDFIRISKSAILNVKHIFSIDKNIASASLVKFYNSHKQVYVSRKYYSSLKIRLNERRSYER